jgi:riboflavin kinase/FMN adenylyltransferase
MKIHYGFDTLPEGLRTVVTVGSFDGVHEGHHMLLRRVMSLAQSLDAESAVVTFEPHPRIAMGRAEGMRLLTTVQERALLLGRYGVDHVVVAHFDEAFRSQSFEQFVRESLVAKLGMVGMVVGYNHRLGRGNEGNYDNLQPLGQELGFALERVEQYTDSGDKVSSTVLRGMLERGEAERAHEIMGHPYIIMGKVCDGVLRVEDEYKLLPCDGKYSALVCGEPTTVEVCGRELRVESQDRDIIIEL